MRSFQQHGKAEPRAGSPRAARSPSRPCARLMAWWQIVPDRRWIRLDIVNVALLPAIAYGMRREMQ